MDTEKNASWKRALTVLRVMFKVGFFTWGGGWSIIAQLQKEFIEKRNWMTQEELVDIISVGRSMPGIMVMNVSVLFGYQIGGIPGVFCSVLGIASPSVLVLVIVTGFYTQIKHNVYVAKALVGVRAAVIPIIGGAALKMRKTAWVDYKGYLITAAAFLLCALTPLHNIFIVLAGAAAGLILQGGHKDGVS